MTDAQLRPSVTQLLQLGPMPPERDADASVVELYQTALASLATEPPLSDGEVAALLAIFPRTDESFFGLAWTLLHELERSPSWRREMAADATGDWVAILRDRLANSVEIQVGRD